MLIILALILKNKNKKQNTYYSASNTTFFVFFNWRHIVVIKLLQLSAFMVIFPRYNYTKQSILLLLNNILLNIIALTKNKYRQYNKLENNK